MNKLCLLVAAAIGLLPSIGLAQEKLSHVAIFPKGDAAWKVTFEKNTNDEKPPRQTQTDPEIRFIDIVQKGDLRRDTTHWADGSTSDAWWMPKWSFALVKSKKSGDIRGIKMSQLGPRRLDASTFAWISEKNFRGIETFKGKKVQSYELETALEDGAVSKSFALIEKDTGFPVLWSDGSQNLLFSFDIPVPKEPLVMPSDFMAAMQHYETYYAPAKRTGKR